MGRTGMPVAIRLGLSFMETEYIVKGSPLLGVNRTAGYDSNAYNSAVDAAINGNYNPSSGG
jgi:hypothetical protein